MDGEVSGVESIHMANVSDILMLSKRCEIPMTEQQAKDFLTRHEDEIFQTMLTAKIDAVERLLVSDARG